MWGLAEEKTGFTPPLLWSRNAVQLQLHLLITVSSGVKDQERMELRKMIVNLGKCKLNHVSTESS